MEFFIVAYSVPLTGWGCSLLLWNSHVKRQCPYIAQFSFETSFSFESLSWVFITFGYLELLHLETILEPSGLVRRVCLLLELVR